MKKKLKLIKVVEYEIDLHILTGAGFILFLIFIMGFASGRLSCFPKYIIWHQIAWFPILEVIIIILVYFKFREVHWEEE